MVANFCAWRGGKGRTLAEGAAAAAELTAEVDEDLSALLQRSYGVSLEEYAAGGAAPAPSAAAGRHGAGPRGAGADADVYMHDSDDDEDVATEEPMRAVTMHGGHGAAVPGLGTSSSVDWAADLMGVGVAAAGGSDGAGPSARVGAAHDQVEADDPEEDEEDWENAEAVDDEATLEEEEALARAEGTVCSAFFCTLCHFFSGKVWRGAPSLSGWGESWCSLRCATVEVGGDHRAAIV